MAFYPDELSPIDRICSLGKPLDLSDINSIKSRRQWKSLVMGKKEMGMNNFATIAEEKEEEISSEGSQGTTSSKDNPGSRALKGVAVANKKITFPKPRKYITSRVADRKEEAPSEGVGGAAMFGPPLGSPPKDPSQEGVGLRVASATDLPSPAAASHSGPNASESRHLLKDKKNRDLVSTQEFVESYALCEIPLESQWNEALSDGIHLTGCSKQSADKGGPSKFDSDQGLKLKREEKKRTKSNPKESVASDLSKPKGCKKKGEPNLGKSGRAEGESPSGQLGKGKAKAEKGKTLNMKEVVNVYKNLAYGSKEEIKSFVENLSFVKDEFKTENDKNLLSMMNLKALENKIKNFTKKSGREIRQETSTPQEKKPKVRKSAKKNRKAHIDRLARHKVVKVPAVLNNNYLKSSAGASSVEKQPPMKEKEPWKYVGMQSILDKTYFVYPAYPPPVNLKKARKVGAKKGESKRGGTALKDKVEPADAAAAKASDLEPKVKAPQVVLRQNLFPEGSSREKIPSGTTRSTNALNASPSNKSMSRSSATTVCTVEFRPPVGQTGQTASPPSQPGLVDQSLLVYLHGTKAINVRSPYSDKQFSRVKFFRKDERAAPLIKGRRGLPKASKDVSVRNINFPEKFGRIRPLDLLDFDEDIQNITAFLRSQSSPSGGRQEYREGLKKSEWVVKQPPSEEPATAPAAPGPARQQRRQLHSTHPHHQSHHHHHNHHHHHQHGTSEETPTSDSIIHEISRHIEHLQYLPDTEENRAMIARFFDELDRRIEAAKSGPLSFPEIPSLPPSFRPIPILGY